MRLTEINHIRNFRSLEEVGPLPLAEITLFVGPNNSGKSSVLQAILMLQQRFDASARQVRLGAPNAEVRLQVRQLRDLPAWGGKEWHSENGVITINLNASGTSSVVAETVIDTARSVERLPDREPNHLIVPYLSRRRPEIFHEDVREEHAIGVHPDMRYLAAKLTRIAQPAHPRHEVYAKACKQILGVVITAVPAPNGQMPGIFVGASDIIPLADMGAGVAQVVGLLADLALSEDKVFVIEEPENDLHPAALRALLDLIADASERNQFLISTHSNVVLRHLGCQPSSRIYYVHADLDRGWPPTTTIREIPPDPAARSEVLIDLGYELRDFEFFDGWLFLEESSAESVIRDHLIPWFAPDLAGRLRTVSARGVNRVTAVFDDFNRLVLFTQLEQRYRDRAWVIVDGDEPGRAVIAKLRERYADGWSEDRFRALTATGFEHYYPSAFAEQTGAISAETDKRRRRELKAALLEEVLTWIEERPEEARSEFETSAAEIVAILREIERQLGDCRAIVSQA